MTLAEFKRRRRERAAAEHHPRSMCWRCRQPGFGCYCGSIEPIALSIHFVILIHPIEVKRRIATGRMAHLCLRDSTLIEGYDFTADPRVAAIVGDPSNHCVVLYPGPRAINLSTRSRAEIATLTPPGKRLVVFVIDGTWNTAARMMRNDHLAHLPKISFAPGAPSRFRVRLQPAPECLSTIEAIHRVIDALAPDGTAESRAHDRLLAVFDHLVEYQLLFNNRGR